jgi:hypothetical protein
VGCRWSPPAESVLSSAWKPEMVIKDSCGQRLHDKSSALDSGQFSSPLWVSVFSSVQGDENNLSLSGWLWDYLKWYLQYAWPMGTLTNPQALLSFPDHFTRPTSDVCDAEQVNSLSKTSVFLSVQWRAQWGVPEASHMESE